MWTIKDLVPIKLAVIEIAGLELSTDETAFRQIIECSEYYRQLFAEKKPYEIAELDHARRLFKSIGIDPTKRRPSSESLLRRALKNQDFYPVNILVDIGNWCSLEYLLPICVYDLDKITGNVEVRLGRKGECYEALNNSIIDFEDRFVIADEKGPFGSPMTDSLRTSVTLGTKNTAIAIFAPDDYNEDILTEFAGSMADRVTKICSGDLLSFSLLNKTNR